ncbi:MAG: hypothetical protein RBS17_07855 [Coriobacteriia bacterium]|nr:hypothetical protein [Coriobacteriia bacterium]
MARSRVPVTVRPRTVVVGMVVIIAAAAAVVVAILLWPQQRPGQVDLAGPTKEIVSFAGVFPAIEDESLVNPLGIAFDGEYLYVAESDAGVVRVFDTRGGVVGSIVLPVADGQVSAYPSVIAVAGRRLAIVDNAGNRVIIVDAEPAELAKVTVVLGAEGEAPRQPTAVTYAVSEFFVADSADKTIKVYNEEGVHQRTLEPESLQAESAITALCVKDGLILATGSSSGAVYVLDGENGAVAGDPFGGYSMARTLEPVGEEVFAIVDGLDRSVTFADLGGAERAMIDSDSVPDAVMSSPRGATWIGDDGRLYVTDSGSGRVFVYNVRAVEL